MRQLFIFCLVLATATGCSRSKFFQESALYTGEMPGRAQSLSPETADTVLVKAGRHYSRGWFHTIWFGKKYRQVWDAPVPAPVFRPEKIAGGLETTKIGGGMQTTSLTLENEEGKQYALRTIDKDPGGVLAKWLQFPFLVNMVRDQTAAINPYAPFVLPPLAKAAGIFHTTPSFYFIADNDESLGEYAGSFQGKVVLFEEKFKSEDDLKEMFGEATDFVNSKKMLRRRYEKGDHQPDQEEFARARLFDLLINDWDRHEGQWEWAVYKKKDLKLYRPVPKDRDQAFFYFQDGVLPWILSRRIFIRKFRSFKHEYGDVKGLVQNAHFIDSRALNEVTSEKWDQLAREMQAALTDEVIEAAIRQFPDTVYQLVGATTVAKLKNRRDLLANVAQKMYKIQSEEVTVVGSDQVEHFEVNRLNNDETKVTVHVVEEDKPAEKILIYSRVFRNRDTDHIILHGLGEDDVFELKGEVNRGIKITIYGGPGEDTVTDKSVVRQGRNMVVVRDTKVATHVEKGKNTKLELTSDVRVHAYDREGY